MRFPLFFNIGTSTQVIQVIDTHDGERKRKQWERERRAKEELREQITAALEYATGERLEPALEEIARPGPQPLVERVDLDALVSDIELSRAVRSAAAMAGLAAARREQERARERAEAQRREQLERDDDDVIMLLLL